MSNFEDEVDIITHVPLPHSSMAKKITPAFWIVLFGFVIRLVYAAFSHDFWFDEAFNYQLAQNSPREIVKALSFDTWPPLYTLFMHYWQTLGQSVLFLRLPSVIFGTLTLIVIYKIAKLLEVFGNEGSHFRNMTKRAQKEHPNYLKFVASEGLSETDIKETKSKLSLVERFLKWRTERPSNRTHSPMIALVLTAVSPPLVYFSAENRGYALFALLATLTIYFYLKMAGGWQEWKGSRQRAVDHMKEIKTSSVKSTSTDGRETTDRTRRFFILFIASAALALYTHYFAGLLLISLPIASYITKTFEVKLKTLLFAYLAILILITPWLLYTLGNPRPECLCASALIGPFYSLLFMNIGGGGFITLKRFFDPQTPILIRIFLLAFASTFTYFFAKSTSFKKPVLWLITIFFLPIIFLFFVSFYKPLFSIRSLIFLVPIFLILVSSRSKNTLFPLITLLSLVTLLITAQHPFFNQEPLGQMAQTLKSYASVQIIHANLYTYLPARYYEPTLDQQVLTPNLPQPLITSLDIKTFGSSGSFVPFDTSSIILVYALDRTDNKILQLELTDLYNAYGQPEELNLGNIRILIFRPKNA